MGPQQNSRPYKITEKSVVGFSHCPNQTRPAQGPCTKAHLCVVVAAIFKFHVSMNCLDTEEGASNKIIKTDALVLHQNVHRQLSGMSPIGRGEALVPTELQCACADLHQHDLVDLYFSEHVTPTLPLLLSHIWLYNITLHY